MKLSFHFLSLFPYMLPARIFIRLPVVEWMSCQWQRGMCAIQRTILNLYSILYESPSPLFTPDQGRSPLGARHTPYPLTSRLSPALQWQDTGITSSIYSPLEKIYALLDHRIQPLPQSAGGTLTFPIVVLLSLSQYTSSVDHKQAAFTNNNSQQPLVNLIWQYITVWTQWQQWLYVVCSRSVFRSPSLCAHVLLPAFILG